MKKDFRELLNSSEQVVIADGGLVTSLYDKGFYINRSFEELSVTDAEAVREVTQSFKNAGALLLCTNTFNAITTKLAKHGIQDKLKNIIESSIEITKDVAADEAYVLGAIGPLGVMLEPLGPTSVRKADEVFSENLKIMNEQAVDAISFLAFHDLNELRVAVMAAKKHTQLPILTHIGIQESMKTSYGHSLEEYIQLCDELGVDVVGLSGEVGPSGMLTALEKIRSLTKKPISICPNAGLPRYVNDEYIYMCNPDYMGKFAKRFAQAGANIIGGHSGVNESHIQAIKNSIRMVKSGGEKRLSYEQSMPSHIQELVDQPQELVPLEKRSRLGEKLAKGEMVVSVEINPPRGVDISKFFEHCKQLDDGGVEFVNIPDGARAMARMSSLQLSSFVRKNFNLEPIPHFTSRDRNLLGLQSDILGTYVNGVRNLLMVTGDPPKLGNCPGATAVYDVDAIGLTHIANRFNQGLDLGGSSFGKPTEFVHGVALNPTTNNQELEIRRFKFKEEAGANFAITQPIYDLEAYYKFMDSVGDSKMPIIMGIWPLVSLRNAEFLKNEVPGVSVPDWVINEMKKAGDSKEEALKRGVDIAIETMQKACKNVAGFQVSAPFNKVDVALKVIHTAKSW